MYGSVWEERPRHSRFLLKLCTSAHLFHKSGQIPATRKNHEDGTNVLEFTRRELVASEEDDQEQGARDVEASRTAEPNRAHPFLRHRLTMTNREVSPACWGMGRGLSIRPIFPGEAGGDECKESWADAAARGEVGDESSGAEACEVYSCTAVALMFQTPSFFVS